MTKIDKVTMYDSETYQECGQLPITLLKTETREANEIISIGTCQNEEYIAVVSGKNLVGGAQKINQLFVFRKVAGTFEYE